MKNDITTNSHKSLAGMLAGGFVNSKLTIIVILVSILLGFASVIFIPKEEEPQIVVPMIDILVNANGLSAKEVEREITEVIERGMWGIDNVEYIYSQSQKHRSFITVRFKVNSSLEDSLLKVHDKIMQIRASLPKQAMEPQVRSFSIDDVPFLLLSFSSASKSNYQLRQMIAHFARQLSSITDVNKIELLGGQKQGVQIIVDKNKLISNGVSIVSVAEAIKNNDLILPAGKNIGSQHLINIDVGGRFNSVEDIKNVSVGYFGGRIVRVKDIANVINGAEDVKHISSIYSQGGQNGENAVSISLAKRKGVNAVLLSKQIIQHTKDFIEIENAKGGDLKMDIMRDYGKTAKDKTNELIEHIFIATVLVSLLIAAFMGFRAALIVAIAIPVTLALTIASFYFMGYTLNRVTLFALVFAIGILVDDAIVVVENIERHFHLHYKGDGGNFRKIAVMAVAEIGGSTILATFAVIIAILPMTFVQGLMGPYMKPIPVGSSFAMTFSLLIAFIVTPWAAVRLLKPHHFAKNGVSGGNNAAEHKISKLDILYEKIMHLLLDRISSSVKFLFFIMFLFFASCSLVYFKVIKIKMLPFDNKNEFQITVDYPIHTTLIDSHRLSGELAGEILLNSEVLKVQVFSGQAAPFSFSGMVKHTFMRKSENMSDLQILLTDKHLRKQSSHEVIESIRKTVNDFAARHNATTKILEVPPGPPVLATMVAEVYANSDEDRLKTANEVYQLFKSEPSLVDVDISTRVQGQIKNYNFNYQNGGLFGINASAAAYSGYLLFGENKLSSLISSNSPEEVDVTLAFDKKVRGGDNAMDGIRLQSFQSGIVDVSSVLNEVSAEDIEVIYHKNLRKLTYITAELSGDEEAPVYGIIKLSPKMKEYSTSIMKTDFNLQKPHIKWDGEMFITLEVFRDLGTAFAFAIVGIYILILIKFKSFLVPIVVMAPIPISLIGVLFGHALLGKYFSAPSMIGFMAGAGIIVRNSIILIDFIEHKMSEGLKLKDAVIISGVLRFRPMLLTAAAVIFGSLIMLQDAIFGGFAVSLIFGEIAATLLSRFTIPILYYFGIGKMRERALKIANNE